MMSISLKRALVFILVAALAYMSWWLNTGTMPVRQVSEQGTRHDPDYYANNLRVYSLNAMGQAEYQLHVDQIYHYPDDNTAELAKPVFVLYENNTASWRISADSGKVLSNGEQVRLTGNVLANLGDTLNDNKDPANRGPSMSTNELLIIPDRKTAETNEKVLIRDKTGKTEATGMKADLGNSRLQLLSGVRGVYENP